MIFKQATERQFVLSKIGKIVVWVGNYIDGVVKSHDIVVDVKNHRYIPSKPRVSTLGRVFELYKDRMDALALVLSDIAYVEQLNKLSEQYDLSNLQVYFLSQMRLSVEPYELPLISPNAPQKIPKIIHYCWFGGKPIPKFLQKCIDSWYKFHPDWEIMRWDESNYDVRKNEIVATCYNNNMFAELSDYARFDVIYEHGGIFLEADVEVVKPLDRFLYDECFMAYDGEEMGTSLRTFGAVPNHSGVKKALQSVQLENVVWLNNDVGINYGHIDVIENGNQPNRRRNIYKVYENNVTVYPNDVLSCICRNGIFEFITENTHAIHYHANTWNFSDMNDQRAKLGHHVRKMFRAIFGEDFYKTSIRDISDYDYYRNRIG